MLIFFRIQLLLLIILIAATTAFADDKCASARANVDKTCNLDNIIKLPAACESAVKFCMGDCKGDSKRYAECSSRNAAINKMGEQKSLDLSSQENPTAAAPPPQGVTVRPTLGLPSTLETPNNSYGHYLDQRQNEGLGIGIKGSIPLGTAN